MTTTAQAVAHRRDLRVLTDLARTDLQTILDQTSTAEEARDALIDALPAMVALYGAAAATLAADWYDDLRDADGASGGFRAIPAETPGPERTDILARFGVGPLFQPEPDRTAALVLLAGGLQRIIATADRETITLSTIEDPAAVGWVRVVSPGACPDICQPLAGQLLTGPDFASHDHCSCVPAPQFRD